jgi:FAD/FMN-containing dehydrogenase
VEVADPGAAHLAFSAKAPSRIAPQLWSVVITAAGQPAVVDRHARELGHMASAANAAEFVPLSNAEHSSVLARIREFPRLVLEGAPSAAIVRISVLPSAMPALLGQLSHLAAQNHLEFAALTRACGLVYAAFLPEEGDAAPAALAKTCSEVFLACAKPEVGAQAMLEWCPTEVKRAADGVWGPARQDFALMQRVKNVFDPQNVLSPGRFVGGI